MPITDYEKLLACQMSSHRETRHLKALTQQERVKFEEREDYLFRSGWDRLMTSEEYEIGHEHGYYGVAYIRIDDRNNAEVIIAHRGTCFDERGNIIADIQIAACEQPGPGILFNAAKPYYKRLRKENNFRGFTTIEIVHTGFSLGGFIAGAMGASSRNRCVTATTFDAPGISCLAADLRSYAVTNYVVTQPNIVNTTNQHVGVVRQICDLASTSTEAATALEFTLELTDLGFDSAPPITASMNSHELRRRLERSQQQAQRRTHSLTAMRELLATQRSHNLEAIITTLEQSQQLNLRFRTVYRWPSASNTFRYDIEPLVDNSVTMLNATGVIGHLLNLILVVSQGAKFIAAKTLWNLTKRSNPDLAQDEGVVAVTHNRPINIIFYTQADYQRYVAAQQARELPQPLAAARAPVAVPLSTRSDFITNHREPPQGLLMQPRVEEQTHSPTPSAS